MYIDVKSLVEKWVKALRSGEYKQTKYKLQDVHGYCCLGVACAVFTEPGRLLVDETWCMLGEMPDGQPNAPEWISKIASDFEELTGTTLTSLNDGSITKSGAAPYKLNFDEIADLLEAVYILEVLND